MEASKQTTWTWGTWNAELSELTSKGLVVLVFSAPGCQPCIPVKKALVQLAERGLIRLYLVDATQEAELAEHYAVSGVPTVLSFINGAMVDHCQGPETRRIAERVLSFVPSKREAGMKYG